MYLSLLDEGETDSSAPSPSHAFGGLYRTAAAGMLAVALAVGSGGCRREHVVFDKTALCSVNYKFAEEISGTSIRIKNPFNIKESNIPPSRVVVRDHTGKILYKGPYNVCEFEDYTKYPVHGCLLDELRVLVINTPKGTVAVPSDGSVKFFGLMSLKTFDDITSYANTRGKPP